MKKLLTLFLLLTLVSISLAGIDDSYTKSLLHFNSDFTDESGKVWSMLQTLRGAPQLNPLERPSLGGNL